jgi:hypothetical protein
MVTLRAHDWALSYDAHTGQCVIDFRLEHSTLRVSLDREKAQDLAAALQIYDGPAEDTGATAAVETVGPYPSPWRKTDG